MSRLFKLTGLAELREIGEVILLPKQGKMKNMENKVLVLNDVAAYLWKLLERGFSEDALIGAALENYEVNKATLISDVKYFLNTLEYIQLIKSREAAVKGPQAHEQAPPQKRPYRTPKIYVYNLETNEEMAYGPHIRGESRIHRAVMRIHQAQCC